MASRWSGREALTVHGMVDRAENALLRSGLLDRVYAVLRRTIYPPLLKLAGAYRRRIEGVSFVAVTGSAGKTTTTAMIHAALAESLPLPRFRNGDNRARGLIQGLRGVRHGHCAMVKELAATGPGSLAPLLAAMAPDIGVVTSVGLDHYSAFRGIEAVAKEKASLVEVLPPGGLAVLNADDPNVAAMASKTRARVILCGRAETADFRAVDVSSHLPDFLRMTVIRGGTRLPVTTQLAGEHWVFSVLATFAVAETLGVEPAAAAAAITRFEPPTGRQRAVTLANGAVLIQDDWKAPAWSLPASLKVLAEARAERKILVLGHLSDTSRKPRDLYRPVARDARRLADLVVLVGQWAEHGLAARTDPSDESIVAFTSIVAARDFLARTIRGGDVVLFKGTGRVGHFERLFMSLAGTVRCWRHPCLRQTWCSHCPRLTKG